MRITQVRSAGRGVVLAVCALVVAGLSGVMAPAASGAAAFFSSLVVPVSGSQAGFSLSGCRGWSWRRCRGTRAGTCRTPRPPSRAGR